MKIIITRQVGSILLATSLAISVALAAPQGTSSLSSSSSSPTSTSTTSTTATSSTTTSTPTSTAASPSSQPKLASLRDGAKSMDSADELATFDGKNPFADDSLWQIPVHLVRDLSASDAGGSSESMARSASKSEPLSSSATANLDESDDDDLSDEGALRGDSVQPAWSSSSPSVISASTTGGDLKTAAGYHHGSYHGHGHGHGHAGHGGDHYGGKYFQYASVPYPYAWDFGYRRGNPYHTIERYEHGKGPHFKTKVKWSDKNGYGVHVWDYNHDDHHSHHYGGGGHHEDGHHGPSSHYGGHHHYGHH